MTQWDLLQGGQGLLAAIRGDSTLAFHDGAEIADPGIVAELEQAGSELAVPGPPGLGGRLVACRAAGTLTTGDEEGAFDAPALRWEGEDGDGELRRSIAILLEDGDLVCVRTAGSVAEEHGEEARTAAFTGRRQGQVDAAEVLLSTEYGADGVQRRATLELWPDDAKADMPLRGAGVLLCSASREVSGMRRTVAFFAWSVEGRAGIGRYEIARAA